MKTTITSRNAAYYLATSLALASVLTACAGGRPPADRMQDEVTGMDATPLPAPRIEGEHSLEESLRGRRSVRSFSQSPLTAAEIGQLLWAAQGITDPRGYRTSPSAGALYPLEIYLVDAQGVHRYLPRDHALSTVVDGNRIEALFAAALEQDAVREAPVTIVVAAVYQRTAAKYGTERAPRYVHLEAGHAAQNILLQAVSLGLAAVPVGAFRDAQVQSALGLPADHQPLYLIPVGHAR